MWVHGEKGPQCFCGSSTHVWISDNEVFLMCLLHTPKEGVLFPLPPEKPDNWPNLSDEEMQNLFVKGQLGD